MRSSIVALALIALASGPAVAVQPSVAGDWALNFSGPQGPMDASATFAQDGENVTGTIDGPQGRVDCTGTLKDTKLSLSLTVDAGGQVITIVLVGDVDGDTIKGTFDLGGGMGSGDWQGKRKAGN